MVALCILQLRLCRCQVWDLRKNDVLYRMHGHADTVTGTELSPDGSYLLTAAMDNTGECHCCPTESFAIICRVRFDTVVTRV